MFNQKLIWLNPGLLSRCFAYILFAVFLFNRFFFFSLDRVFILRENLKIDA